MKWKKGSLTWRFDSGTRFYARGFAIEASGLGRGFGYTPER